MLVLSLTPAIPRASVVLSLALQLLKNVWVELTWWSIWK